VHVAQFSLDLRHNAHNPYLALPTHKHRLCSSAPSHQSSSCTGSGFGPFNHFQSHAWRSMAPFTGAWTVGNLICFGGISEPAHFVRLLSMHGQNHG